MKASKVGLKLSSPRLLDTSRSSSSDVNEPIDDVEARLERRACLM